MNESRISTPEHVQPVEGQIEGGCSIIPGISYPFDFRNLVYTSSTTHTYLRAVEGPFELILSGALNIEMPGLYRISEKPGDIEALFFIHQSEYQGYEPAEGGLYVTSVTDEAGHKKLEGYGVFNLMIEDGQGNRVRMNINITAFNFATGTV